MKNLYIATDVSCHRKKYNPNLKEDFSVWACLIKTDGEKYTHVDKFKSQVSSGKAEIRAMANALAVANKLYDLSEYKITFFSDHINNPFASKPVRADKKKLRNQFLSTHLLPYVGKAAGFEFVWVKGHTKVKDRTEGHSLQHWCDIECRKLSRKIIKEIQNEPLR